MLRIPGRTASVFIICTVLTSSVSAQEFRIFTRIYDMDAAESRDETPPVASRSLTLFHAAKVYDSIPSIGEVIIFAPSERQITILSEPRMLMTTVQFDELKHLLKMVKQETGKYILEQETTRTPLLEKEIAALRFQLDPRFEEEHNAQERRLVLTSPFLRYTAGYVDDYDREIVKTYLEYADWIARLNSVLHPHSLYPAPRLALNASLRRGNVFPVNVELQAAVDRSLHLRAEHNFSWKLDSVDRDRIQRWERLPSNQNMRRVPFNEYQRALLAGNPKSSR